MSSVVAEQRRQESVELAPVPAAEIWLGVHRENRQVPRVRTVLDCIAEAVRGRAAALNPEEPADTADWTEAPRTQDTT